MVVLSVDFTLKRDRVRDVAGESVTCDAEIVARLRFDVDTDNREERGGVGGRGIFGERRRCVDMSRDAVVGGHFGT